MADNERVAKLEERLKFLKELLGEVRDVLKSYPSPKDYEDLKEEQESIKKQIDKLKPLVITVGVISGILGIIGGILLRYLFV